MNTGKHVSDTRMLEGDCLARRYRVVHTLVVSALAVCLLAALPSCAVEDASAIASEADHPAEQQVALPASAQDGAVTEVAALTADGAASAFADRGFAADAVSSPLRADGLVADETEEAAQHARYVEYASKTGVVWHVYDIGGAVQAVPVPGDALPLDRMLIVTEGQGALFLEADGTGRTVPASQSDSVAIWEADVVDSTLLDGIEPSDILGFSVDEDGHAGH